MKPVAISFPFRGHWLARNSPARKVPSHGSDLLGTTYSVDFIGVKPTGRTAPWGLASTFWKEENEKFPGFGRPILAPISGTVTEIHDGEPDHEVRRSQLTLLPYYFNQLSRLRKGGKTAISGNYVSIALTQGGPFVSLFHLKKDSIRVQPGDRVEVGEHIADCGNSGNSTQPHVHVQVTDSPDLMNCTGLPMAFVQPSRSEPWMPGENEVFEV